MAPRRKAARIEAPATLEQAIGLIGEYLTLAETVDGAKATADSAIRQIEEARDELVAPKEAAMRDIFLQLRTWWTVAREDLTGGKKKSIELAGALIGDRIGTPALKLPKGMKVDDAVAVIQSLAETFDDAKGLLRTKVELDKPPLIKLLGNATAVGPIVERLRTEGFKVHQSEDFFIDRAAKKDADPVVETTPEETAA